ncbi:MULTISPECIES: helix-turn-helix domain-containing protein [Pseudothermotoga]|jgi:hypothetical protein|uniref:Transcriptional regulator, XRE family n=1 Tax=Pseudothermotoga lettingae (strain ATCC BAA-301 / DSM 14385 / NBRC 107922 / TMO) TaxID=416591 RepID=A8F8W5_PSELT|nr:MULTISPECIES: helix-turn-helix domain-containing protein [Pseudothermotoga]ABV34599.1 conserved hypothetical protein [Pseudothermotoga lettingae TMO]KUK21286.1 MAG: Uncharacterized protein XD56_0794 [Pseudothermotoga lettingae]MDI3494789.1 cytoskeleton protein RodZ [Pseudothermotoga sp.]MDK2883455.1 cytoskeleton protein RodZ [Pseudothermotoga sp.]GLI48455.1 transcriptional regulator [Pseudothermotoga lettingae TMO]
MEKWVKIGEILKNSRESKQLTIDQVAQSIGIPAWKIRLIEEGQFDRVDAPFYVKHYIRSYSEFLEIDPEELLSEIEQPVSKQAEVKKVSGNGALISFLLIAMLIASVCFFAYSALKFFDVASSPEAQFVNNSGQTVYFNERPVEPGEIIELEIGNRYRVNGNKGICSIITLKKEWNIHVSDFEVILWER